MSTQLPLIMTDRDRAELASATFRRVLREIAEEHGIKVLGEEWGCGHATVSNKLDERERRHLSPAEIFDIAFRDPHGRAVAAFCDLSGFERPERKRILDAADKLARLEDVLKKTLGDDVNEMLHRKAGIR